MQLVLNLLLIVDQRLNTKERSRPIMSILDQIKAAIARALGRFAKNKAEHQAQGMTEEARGIVSGAREMARQNPLGFATLAALGVGLVWLSLRRRHVDVS